MRSSLEDVLSDARRCRRIVRSVLRFTGRDGDIDIDTADPEFAAWKWVAPAALPRLVVPFKRALYRAVLAEFREHLDRPA